VAIVFPCPGVDNSTDTGESVCREMIALLHRRRAWKISRKTFLAAWSELRRRLEQTKEYQQFRYAVLQRDRYRCRSCNSIAHTVHHRRRVARRPDLALKVSNGEVICTECHAKRHPCLRRAS
jgi:5-methylcytosine-specific restriction endonuclease McrA